jgi:hypothetical protein
MPVLDATMTPQRELCEGGDDGRVAVKALPDDDHEAVASAVAMENVEDFPPSKKPPSLQDIHRALQQQHRPTTVSAFDRRLHDDEGDEEKEEIDVRQEEQQAAYEYEVCLANRTYSYERVAEPVTATATDVDTPAHDPALGEDSDNLNLALQKSEKNLRGEECKCYFSLYQYPSNAGFPLCQYSDKFVVFDLL